MLAFLQQMRTERNHAIPCLEIGDDRSRFVAKADDLHGTPLFTMQKFLSL